MITELTAVAAATTQTIKLIAGLADSIHDAKMKEAVSHLQAGIIDLQGKLFGAQAQFYELVEARQTAEQKLLAYEKWDAEAARYELKELVAGIPVYALKPDQANGEPPHFICPHCFQQRKKAILHRPAADQTNYICDGCTFNVRPANTPMPTIQMVRTKSLNRMGGL